MDTVSKIPTAIVALTKDNPLTAIVGVIALFGLVYVITGAGEDNSQVDQSIDNKVEIKAEIESDEGGDSSSSQIIENLNF